MVVTPFNPLMDVVAGVAAAMVTVPVSICTTTICVPTSNATDASVGTVMVVALDALNGMMVFASEMVKV